MLEIVNENQKNVTETGNEESPELVIDLKEIRREKIAKSDLGAQERGGEFYTQTPAGEVRVNAPSQYDTLFHQAQETTSREQLVKRRLQEQKATVGQQIETAKKTMLGHQKAFTEARHAQDILDDLATSGKILKIEEMMASDPQLPENSLRFTIAPELLGATADKFRQLGYLVKNIPGKGIVAQGDFNTYIFLTSTRQRLESTPEQDSDFDYDDEESAEGAAQKGITRRRLGKVGRKRRTSRKTAPEGIPLTRGMGTKQKVGGKKSSPLGKTGLGEEPLDVLMVPGTPPATNAPTIPKTESGANVSPVETGGPPTPQINTGGPAVGPAPITPGPGIGPIAPGIGGS